MLRLKVLSTMLIHLGIVPGRRIFSLLKPIINEKKRIHQMSRFTAINFIFKFVFNT